MFSLAKSFAKLAMASPKPTFGFIKPFGPSILPMQKMQIRFKSDHKRVEWLKTKVASKRKTKKYKLKNHKGAVSRYSLFNLFRWLVSPSFDFIRGQAVNSSNLHRAVIISTLKCGILKKC